MYVFVNLCSSLKALLFCDESIRQCVHVYGIMGARCHKEVLNSISSVMSNDSQK